MIDELRHLALGQSNMNGQLPAGGLAFSVADSRSKFWNNNGNMGTGTDYLGTSFINPVEDSRPFKTNGSGPNNLVVWEGHQLTQIARNVRNVLIGQDGADIDWFLSGGAAYDRIRDVWPLAFANSEKAQLVTIAQGETMPNQSTYKADHQTMRDGLVTDGIVSADAQWLLCGLASQYSDEDAILQEIADENADVHYVSVEGLETSDGSHWTPESLGELGMRAGQKAIPLLARNS